MKELDRLLESTEINKLLNMDFSSFSDEDIEYLFKKVTEIADEKCYEVGIIYTIRDVELIEKLNDKLKLIELALTLAYDSKTNYDDVFSQIRMWDALIYNHLREKNMVLPPLEKHRKDAMYIGAYVKNPQIGMHNWIASFDLTSLYPSLIMQYNLSPETLLETDKYDEIHRNIINNNVDIGRLLSTSINLTNLKSHTLTPNGQFFSIEKEGFMPEITRKMFDDRQKYKKKMLETQKELEKIESEIKKRNINKN